MTDRREKLAKGSIGRLLFQLSLPATIAMMVNGLYNVVDTIFIGQGINADAIGGLAIAFPLQMLIMGFAQMIGIGAASAVSRNLGANKVEKADQVAGNAFTSVVVISLTFTVISLAFIKPLLLLFGADEVLLPYAIDYSQIILLGSVFFSFAMMTNALVRAEGNAKVAMTTMIIGTVLNIILDPIFIFTFNMGIKGAALATILAQFVSAIYILRYMYSGRSSLKIKLHHLKPKLDIIKEIFSVGFSALARSSTSTIFAIVVNNSLKLYGGTTAIIIFGVVNRVVAFLFMPIIGVVQGMQPIAGYNYGAKSYDRVKKVLELSLIVSTIIGIVGWAIGQTIPHIIIRAFTNDTYIIEEGAFVFRIVIAMIPLLGLQFIGTTFFQALGKAIPSLILSLLRQFILLVPLILILPRIYNLKLLGVWLAFPIADLIASLITASLLLRQVTKMNNISMNKVT